MLRFLTPTIHPSQFQTWHDYYSRYQYLLARDYICPRLEKWGVGIHGARILDAGCGDGGFARALVDQGASVVGIDIKKFDWPPTDENKLRFLQGDLCEQKTIEKIDSRFDLIIVRDVIEHILDKPAFFKNVLSLLEDGGKLFFSFPPFYSPFGAHQQVFLKSFLKAVPYLHWLPDRLYVPLLRAVEQGEAHWREILDIRQTRTSIRLFRSLVKQFNLQILGAKYYLFRPTFKIRYGLPPLEAFWGPVPWLNEISVLGVYFLLGR